MQEYQVLVKDASVGTLWNDVTVESEGKTFSVVVSKDVDVLPMIGKFYTMATVNGEFQFNPPKASRNKIKTFVEPLS